MVERSKGQLTAIITLILSLLALAAAVMSLVNKSIYYDAIRTGVFLEVLLPGTLAQDVVAVAAGLSLALLSFSFLKKQRYKCFILILGLDAFFFYAYGLFVIGGSYTSLYPLYLVIFMLSTFSLMFGLSAFRPESLKRLCLPPMMRKITAGFLLFIVLLFVPMWLASVFSSSSLHVRPDFYAVYVMDLCIIMPALTVIAVMLLRNIQFGYILGGVALLKTLTLILSVAIGTALAPVYGLPLDYPMLGVYALVVSCSLVLGTFYMLNLQ